MNQKALAIFDHVHQKIIESAFSFPEFVPAGKKMTSFCLFILSTLDRLAPPIFDNALPKKF